MPGRRWKCVCCVAAVLLSLGTGVARAEGFLEFLFGKFNDSSWPSTRTSTPAASRPITLTVRPRSVNFARGTVFCVRMCDGRHFPIQRSAAVQPSKICNSLCPAARTKVFAGSEISRAVAADGSHYSGLDQAFLYREQTVDDCSCNGITNYGLASMDAREDPTLRAGDLVATPAGLVRSVARPKELPRSALHAASGRDDDIATGSSLPLGMRGHVADNPQLRRSGPGDLLPIAVPLTIPAR